MKSSGRVFGNGANVEAARTGARSKAARDSIQRTSLKKKIKLIMIIVFQTIPLLLQSSASFAMLSLAVLSVATFGSPAPSPWTKVLLTDAVARGAVCLDGSPGGYYIKFPPNQKTNNLNKKWVRTSLELNLLRSSYAAYLPLAGCTATRSFSSAALPCWHCVLALCRCCSTS